MSDVRAVDQYRPLVRLFRADYGGGKFTFGRVPKESDSGDISHIFGVSSLYKCVKGVWFTQIDDLIRKHGVKPFDTSRYYLFGTKGAGRSIYIDLVNARRFMRFALELSAKEADAIIAAAENYSPTLTDVREDLKRRPKPDALEQGEQKVWVAPSSPSERRESSESSVLKSLYDELLSRNEVLIRENVRLEIAAEQSQQSLETTSPASEPRPPNFIDSFMALVKMVGRNSVQSMGEFFVQMEEFKNLSPSDIMNLLNLLNMLYDHKMGEIG